MRRRDEAQIGGERRAIAQSERRRGFKVGDKIGFEWNQRITSRRCRQSIAAGIIGHTATQRIAVLGGRKQNHNGIGNGHTVAGHRASESLRVGKICDRKRICDGCEMPDWTRQLDQILAAESLQDIALKIQLRRDLSVGRAIRVAGHIIIRHATDHEVRSIRQSILLPQEITPINDAIRVGIEKFLDDHRLRVREAGHLHRDRAVVSVADRVRRDGQTHRRPPGSRKPGEQRKHDQQTMKLDSHR